MVTSETDEGRVEREFLRHVIDLDSHEMMPTHLWAEPFGPVAQEFIDLAHRRMADAAENSLVRPDLVGDVVEITDENVWAMKGPGAPGAADLSRRPEVMDVMGVDRQLVFPGFAQAGMFLHYNPASAGFYKLVGSEVDIDRRALAHRVFAAHNDWAIRTTKELGSDRIRIVAFCAGETIEVLMAQAEHASAEGIRAIQIPVGAPPAGMSPADRRLDPFWALCAQANVPIVVHVGSHQCLFASQAWNADVPEFEPTVGESEEFNVEPYGAATLQFAPDNMLCAMISEAFSSAIRHCDSALSSWVPTGSDRWRKSSICTPSSSPGRCGRWHCCPPSTSLAMCALHHFASNRWISTFRDTRTSVTCTATRRTIHTGRAASMRRTTSSID